MLQYHGNAHHTLRVVSSAFYVVAKGFLWIRNTGIGFCNAGAHRILVWGLNHPKKHHSAYMKALYVDMKLT